MYYEAYKCEMRNGTYLNQKRHIKNTILLQSSFSFFQGLVCTIVCISTWRTWDHVFYPRDRSVLSVDSNRAVPYLSTIWHTSPSQPLACGAACPLQSNVLSVETFKMRGKEFKLFPGKTEVEARIIFENCDLSSYGVLRYIVNFMFCWPASLYNLL